MPHSVFVFSRSFQQLVTAWWIEYCHGLSEPVCFFALNKLITEEILAVPLNTIQLLTRLNINHHHSLQFLFGESPTFEFKIEIEIYYIFEISSKSTISKYCN